MISFPRPWLAMACLIAVLAAPPGLSAQQPQPPTPPTPTVRAVSLKPFARHVAAYIDKFGVRESLELLDELTTHQSGTTVVSEGTAVPDSTSFVVTHRVSGIVLSKSLSNRIWLIGNVPGRGLTTTIRTDCLVHEWYTTPQAGRDPARSAALLLTLTPTRLTAEFPEDAEVSTDFGALRAEFLGDGDRARSLRADLYAEAQDLAIARFQAREPGEVEAFTTALRAEVQAARPGNPVHVSRSGAGVVVEIDQFFTPPPESAPVIGSEKPTKAAERPYALRGPLAVTVTAVIVLAVVAYLFIRLRGSL